MSHAVEDLVGEIAATASRLAQQQDVLDSEEPQQALYVPAGAIGSLAVPVAALWAGTPETAAAG
ncbi:hypothetical protein [Streptomyces sp. NPDC053079]|uniref:hypothetical protein n=1 Tax=Streptomyces sp. NPDC053079 TaxID=3365697 RepID=UPI0037D8F6A5